MISVVIRGGEGNGLTASLVRKCCLPERSKSRRRSQEAEGGKQEQEIGLEMCVGCSEEGSESERAREREKTCERE